jgi:hypothetical protein
VAARLTTAWTVFVHTLLRILATLGLKRAAAVAAPAVAATSPFGLIPAQPGPRRGPAHAAVPWPVVARRCRRAPRDRALPPTIKQRIHAEAHGSTPSVRRVSLFPGSDAAPEPAVG